MLEKREQIYTHSDGKQFILRFVGVLPIQYRIELLSDLPSYEIWLSLERAAETVARHPEFNMENIFDITAESGHVSDFLENYFTLWKDGRLEGWKRALPIFHPSILPITKSINMPKFSRFHPYNFIKSLYIVSEVKKGGSPIWEEE